MKTETPRRIHHYSTSAPSMIAATSALFLYHPAPTSGTRLKMDFGGLEKVAKLLASGDRYIVLALVPQQLQLNSNSASPPELLGLLVILVPPRGLPLVNHRAPCGSDLF